MRLGVFLLSFLFLLGYCHAAWAKKVALVIGNNAYEKVTSLQKAVNDARSISATLTDIGFQVTQRLDLSRRAMNLAIHDFVSKIEPGDEALFYFAGHGIEIKGRNYLIATDIPAVKPGSEGFVTKEAFAVAEIIDSMRERGSRVNIIILDACRNNPFPKAGTRSLGSSRGLANFQPPKGTFIMYSAGIGEEALDRLNDNDPNPNSVYTRTLLPLLKTPGISINSMAKKLRSKVDELARSVRHEQYPAYYDQIKGEYFFVRGERKQVKVTDNPIRPAGKSPEALLWETIKNSKRISDYKFYLKKFPNGTNAVIAQLRIQQLTPKTTVNPDNPFLPRKDSPQVNRRADQNKTVPQRRSYRAGDRLQDCPECPQMVVIPSGFFRMGSSVVEVNRKPHEGPARGVTIRKAFAVGQYEITRGQFDSFVRSSGYRIGRQCHIYTGSSWKESYGANYRNPGFRQSNTHPAVCISWYDAQAYIQWLSRKTGHSYRLLTEAEWEYVARAGTKGRYSFRGGIGALCKYGNSADRSSNFSWRNVLCSDGYNNTSPVGSFRANRFGVYDMHGNIWEWVQDCYRRYDPDNTTEQAVEGGECEKGVLRSGAWNSTPAYLRSATRDKFRMDGRYSNGGFRVARTLSESR